MLHEFDEDTQEAIRETLPDDLLQQSDAGVFHDTTDSRGRHWAPGADGARGQESDRTATATLPRQDSRDRQEFRE
jgi:phospholipid/cholesterol/gamma-HCH transport system ATP-binding protein